MASNEPTGAKSTTTNKNDDRRAGIRHNWKHRYQLPPRSGIGRILLKYAIFSWPPFVPLLGILSLHLYPGYFLYVHRTTLLSRCVEGVAHVTGGKGLMAERGVSLVATLCLSFALYNRLFLSSNRQKELPATGTKRVCVIGSGISGILTAKECLEQGHQVTVLEQQHQSGGVWRHRAWSKTMLTSSNMNTSLSDFIFPEVFPENEHPGFATRDQFLSYLDSYTKFFRVDQVIRFGARVLQVEETSTGGHSVTWQQTSESGQVMKQQTQEFDFIAVCTGLPNEPRPCPLEDAQLFEGTISHSKTYESADSFRSKRVLVVGTGESASDIVKEVAHVASEPVGISQHSPVLVLHRDHFESPPDYAENRLIHCCPAAIRWAYLKTLFLFIVNWGHLSTRLYKMPKAFAWLNFLVFYKLPVDFNQPTAACSIVHITKSGCMLDPITEGKAVQLKAATKCLGGKTVQFEDGSTKDYDAIILANGYCPVRFPFLKSLGLEENCQRYHLTFHPDHPRIGFIGYSRGQVGALTTLMEMQARWFALLVSGRRLLPSADMMRRRIEKVKRQVRGKYDTRASWFTANYLARHEVLCEPQLLGLALRRPLLVWKIMSRSFASWQYRLNGPGAQRELVLDAYDSVQLYTNIPGETLHRIIMIAIAVTSHCWWFVFTLVPLPSPVLVVLNGLWMPCTSDVF